MLVKHFMGEHKEHHPGEGRNINMHHGVSRINISIEKINNSPAFVPEAILYVHIRDST